MMHNISLIPVIFLLISMRLSDICAQKFIEQPLEAQIQEVTVFPRGAQIFEKASVNLPVGKHVLVVHGVSAYVDPSSIQVLAKGEFTILSVNHQYNFLEELVKHRTTDSLEQIVDSLDLLIAKNNARAEVLNEKEQLLAANRTLNGSEASMTVDDLRAFLQLYEQETERIKSESITLQRSTEKISETKLRTEQQIVIINNKKVLPSSMIMIRVDIKSPVLADFSISYFVANAGWYPKYDIRVKDITSPLQVTYKAEVFQSTGVDWRDVLLRFSNAVPDQSGTLPELPVWRLNYARNTVFTHVRFSGAQVSGVVTDENGEPLIGANVAVVGTTVGTVTDYNGRYMLALPDGASRLVVSYTGYNDQVVPITGNHMTTRLEAGSQLDEVVVIGAARGLRQQPKEEAAPVETTVLEYQTTVEIEVDIPYTINSSGDKLSIDLNTVALDVQYEYYTVPKKDKAVFLMARAWGWDTHHLLSGEANLFYEEAYVGRTVLDMQSFQDTLDISLGRDKSIVVERRKNEEYRKTRFIGTNTVASREFELFVRNTKSHPVKITIIDQVPVSVVSDITVTPIEISGGILDEPTGRVTWTRTLLPQDQVSFMLGYEVKYPRREQVILE